MATISRICVSTRTCVRRSLTRSKANQNATPTIVPRTTARRSWKIARCLALCIMFPCQHVSAFLLLPRVSLSKLWKFDRLRRGTSEQRIGRPRRRWCRLELENDECCSQHQCQKKADLTPAWVRDPSKDFLLFGYCDESSVVRSSGCAQAAQQRQHYAHALPCGLYAEIVQPSLWRAGNEMPS